MYSNSCCSCSFGTEIIKIGQSSHKMYSNNILNFQESMTILNVCTKKSGNLLKDLVSTQFKCKYSLISSYSVYSNNSNSNNSVYYKYRFFLHKIECQNSSISKNSV